MEIDANKIVPDTSQKVAKMTFLGGVDKTTGNYLQAALNAIIENSPRAIRSVSRRTMTRGRRAGVTRGRGESVTRRKRS
jgi:hypothetical protein